MFYHQPHHNLPIFLVYRFYLRNRNMKNNTPITKLQRGFTLVELLIVVIILAILAAIIVPQFASTTDDAKIASLDTTLSNVRAALDLYYQQHNSVYPGGVASSGAPAACTSAVSGGAAGSEAAIIEQLAYYTNAAGQACKMRGTGNEFKFGPYLKKDTLPPNPITNSNILAISTTGILGLAADGAGLGWKYDNKSGQFIANDSNTDPSGKAYSAH